MNEFQNKLYLDLMALTQNLDAFYFQDFPVGNSVLRIFNYRLASYTDFLAPSALECRGIMFELTDNQGMSNVRLACLPQEKFFNLGENLITMNLNPDNIVGIENKADGSLISSYMFNNQLKLKSKGSISSEQAMDAMAWIELPENVAFKLDLLNATKSNHTVNMEWVAPHNRIVIGYANPQLIVLNGRNNETGQYVDVATLFGFHRLIARVDTKNLNLQQFVASIPDMQDDIEGFILIFASGQRVKIKTSKYISLHHAKDSVNNPRRLFEAVVDEGVDDLRSLFATDSVALGIIDVMQERVHKIYNHMVKVVDAFYDTNKSLDRKSFAIKGQAELEQMHFGLVMNKYTQKPIDYKAFMKSRWKELGFKDVVVEAA